MASRWGDRGGVAGYAAHVREIAEGFEHAPLHPQVWVREPPSSCLPAHLHLCAARAAEQAGMIVAGSREALARELRRRFFVEAEDISRATVLRSAVVESGLPPEPIEELLANGRAHAQWDEDMQLAKDQDVRSSPTLLFNEGRQRLSGNVGYRIIEANVRELLDRPIVQHSWC
jgi:predicted DsbA family dithiol-disulfide isomerase